MNWVVWLIVTPALCFFFYQLGVYAEVCRTEEWFRLKSKKEDE